MLVLVSGVWVTVLVSGVCVTVLVSGVWVLVTVCGAWVATVESPPPPPPPWRRRAGAVDVAAGVMVELTGVEVVAVGVGEAVANLTAVNTSAANTITPRAPAVTRAAVVRYQGVGGGGGGWSL